MGHRIPVYELEQPSITGLESSLSQLLGSESARRTMAEVLTGLELGPASSDGLSLAQQVEIAARMLARGGLVSVAARSFGIRLRNYETLSLRAARAARGERSA